MSDLSGEEGGWSGGTEKQLHEAVHSEFQTLKAALQAIELRNLRCAIRQLRRLTVGPTSSRRSDMQTYHCNLSF